MMLVGVLAAFGLIAAFVYAPKITAAIGAAFVVMFLYVWIFDPQCQNFAAQNPQWHGKCGIEFR